MLSRLITQKALETHLDPEKDKDKISRIVDKIGGEYFSHSFPITRRDIEKELELNVIRPDKDLWNAIWALHTHYQNLLGKGTKLTMDIKNDKTGETMKKDFHMFTLGFIDTSEHRRLLVQVKDVQEIKGAIQEKVVYTGWITPKST
jgi:hypothetical protein